MKNHSELNVGKGEVRLVLQPASRKPLVGGRARSLVAFSALCVAWVLFGASAWKPFHLDSMDLPAVAKANTETGVPVYYRGEGNPRHLGLYHPPLYSYAIAGWTMIFGFGEAQIRMFGFLCVLLQGWVVLEIGRTLLGVSAARQAAPWFWVLFLLNPYTLQSAGIPDIDTTIYGPLLSGIVLLTLRMSWRDGVRREDRIRSWEYGWLIVLFTLALWAKLTTVLVLFPFVFLLLLPRFGIGGAARTAAAVFLGGAGAFLATYYVYGLVTDLDVSYSFSFIVDTFLRRGSSGTGGFLGRLGNYWRNFVAMAALHSLWTGLLPWLVGCAALAASAWYATRFRSPRSLHIALVILLALGTTGFYCALTLTFGYAPFKYTFIFWAIVVACPVFLVTEALRRVVWSSGRARLRTVWLPVVGMTYCLGFVVSAAWVRDTMILASSVRQPCSWSLYLPAALVITGIALWLRRPGAAVCVAALGLAAWGGLSFGVALVQSRAPYSTTYDYGQSGFEETVSYIRTVTKPDEIIACMKDVGFKAARRYYENYAAIYGGPAQTNVFIEALRSKKVRYAVFTEARGQDQLIVNAPLRSWIEGGCTLDRSFGNYRVYDCANGPGKAVR